MAKKQHYKYVIELDTAQWPRKLADELMYRTDLAEHLTSVTDLQNDSHIYGATYTVQDSTNRSFLRRFPFLSALP